jgi:hypothetical protein
MKLLKGKIHVTESDNPYAPLCGFWEKHPSIIGGKYVDMTSAEGDWRGFIVQRTGKRSAQCIGFRQRSNSPFKGYTFFTSEYPFYMGNPDIKGFFERAENYYRKNF